MWHASTTHATEEAHRAKLRTWSVAIMRARAHGLGTVAAQDQKSAEAEAVKAFGLSEDQRRRLLILERE